MHLGNELHIASKMEERLNQQIVNTLAGSQYVLVEFPYHEYQSEYDEELYCLLVDGYKVIIAHPERYEYVRQDLSFCQKWINAGCFIQITQSSLFDTRYQKLAERMLVNNYVRFVSSDAHGCHRPLTLIKAYHYVAKKFSLQLADDLFIHHD